MCGGRRFYILSYRRETPAAHTTTTNMLVGEIWLRANVIDDIGTWISWPKALLFVLRNSNTNLWSVSIALAKIKKQFEFHKYQIVNFTSRKRAMEITTQKEIQFSLPLFSLHMATMYILMQFGHNNNKPRDDDIKTLLPSAHGNI
jgi:hypothetical protein